MCVCDFCVDDSHKKLAATWSQAACPTVVKIDPGTHAGRPPQVEVKNLEYRTTDPATVAESSLFNRNQSWPTFAALSRQKQLHSAHKSSSQTT